MKSKKKKEKMKLQNLIYGDLSRISEELDVEYHQVRNVVYGRTFNPLIERTLINLDKKRYFDAINKSNKAVDKILKSKV